MATPLRIVQSSKLYAKADAHSSNYYVTLQLVNHHWAYHPHPFPTKAAAQSFIKRIHAAGSIDLDLWTRESDPVPPPPTFS